MNNKNDSLNKQIIVKKSGIDWSNRQDFVRRILIFLHFHTLNPNKAKPFQDSFFWGGGANLTLPLYFKKNVSKNNITLYNC